MKKSGIKSSVNHYFVRVRIYSNFSLPVEKMLTFHNVKMLTFHNVITFIKSVVNKNENNYY